MITRLELKNFTKFSDLTMNFSPKVNIILGENGTGKSHLMKAAYAIYAGFGSIKEGPETSEEDFNKAMTNTLLKIFMPLENKIGKLRRHGSGGSENAQITAEFSSGKKLGLNFHTNSKAVALKGKNEFNEELPGSVFIPTKEVLSFMEGFTSLYSKFAVSFDQTYYDICVLLDFPLAREEQLTEKSKWAIREIENTIEGKFVFHGGGRVTFKSADGEFSANAMAEGFRKIGMLSRLLETTSIQPGKSGPLFWDEPEANINPKLMHLLVEILLELARNGQQIILATHDYVLLKCFDLFPNKAREDHVRFHSLFCDPDSG